MWRPERDGEREDSSTMYNRLRGLSGLGQLGTILGISFLGMEIIRAFTALIHDLFLPIVQWYFR